MKKKESEVMVTTHLYNVGGKYTYVAHYNKVDYLDNVDGDYQKTTYCFCLKSTTIKGIVIKVCSLLLQNKVGLDKKDINMLYEDFRKKLKEGNYEV